MDRQFDELRKSWKGLDMTARASAMADDAARRAASGSLQTRKQYVLRVYRVLSIVTALWVGLCPLVLLQSGLPVWISCVSSLYFLVATIMCRYVYRKVRALDFGRMTTIELIDSVREVVTARRRQKIVLVTLMIPFLAALFYSFRFNTPMIAGGITGIVVGGIIGVVKDMHVRRHLKELRDELLSAYD